MAVITLGSERRRAATRVRPAGGGIGLRRGWLDAAVALLVTLACWQLAALSGRFTTAVPEVHIALADLLSLVGVPSFWEALGQTLLSCFLGLALALVLAVPLGLLLGSSKQAAASVNLTVDFMRAIPPVVFIPLLLLLIGPTLQLKLILILSGAMWPLLVQSMAAVREVDPVMRESVRAMRLPWRTRVRVLFVPSAMPFLFTGVRVAAAFSLLFSLAAELIAEAPGLGRAMGAAQLRGDSAEVFAYLIVVGLVGVTINAAMVATGRRLLAWHPSVRGQS